MVSLLMNYILTLFAPVVWGSTYFFTTEFLPPDRPLLAAMMRALPAGLLLILFTRQLPKGIWWFRIFALGTLNIGAFFYLLFLAAYHLPGGVAALVMNTQSIIVLLLSVFLLKQRIRPLQILACVLSIIGVALIALKPNASLDLVGILSGLLGALSMALGIVLTKYWERPEGVGLLTFTGWQLSIGGLVLLPAWLLFEVPPSNLNLQNYLGFAYLSFIGALCAYALWFRGIERLPALTISFLSLASPISAVLIGFLFLNQALTLLQCLGGLLIMLSIVLSQPNALHFIRR